MTGVDGHLGRRADHPRSACPLTSAVFEEPEYAMQGRPAALGQRGGSRLGYSSYLVVVSLVTLEILLRVFDPIGIQYVYEIKRYFRNTVADDILAYRHRPSYRSILQGVDISINGQGFRGPEFQTEKPPHTDRILILGDSVVFGWGVGQDETFPTRVERLLQSQGERVEVIPAGVCSWNTRTEYEFTRTVGVNYRPDVLVLVVVFNDIEPKKEGRTEVTKSELFPPSATKSFVQNAWEDVRRFLAKHSYFFAHLEYAWKETLQQQSEGPLHSDDSPAWKDVRLALDGLVELCAQRGISLIAYLYTTETDLPGDKILTRYKRYLAAKGVPTFVMPAPVLGDPKYRNSVVDGHPNALGHKLIAEHMGPVLREALLKRRQMHAADAHD